MKALAPPWLDELTIGGATARLLHLGFVVDDLDGAIRSFALPGQRSRQDWTDPAPRSFALFYRNARIVRHLRIVHSVTPWPRCELIQQCDDSPWESATPAMPHHLCYASTEAAVICAELERTSYRMLGRSGEDSGYFRQPDGLILEILPASSARMLYSGLAGFPALSK